MLTTELPGNKKPIKPQLCGGPVNMTCYVVSEGGAELFRVHFVTM